MSHQQVPQVPRSVSLRLKPLVRSLTILAIVGSVGLSLLPATPTLHPVPYRDSGVFLYVGQRILEGDVPYRDVWDHKPPGIHLVNALGLTIAGGSMWGVWAMQALALLTAGLLGWHALGRSLTPVAAVLATLSWLVGLPFVLQLGNTTEEYALPLQMCAILLFLEASRDTGSRKYLLAGIGAVGAALLLLKPNLVGLPAAAVVLLALHRRSGSRRGRWSDGMAVTAGALAVAAPILVWLASRSALADFADAALHYNLAYSNADWSHRFDSMAYGFRVLARPSTSWLAALGWLAAVIVLIRSGSRTGGGLHAVALLAAVATPAEVILATFAGRDYPHYFASWLPVCALCTATLVDAAPEMRTTMAQRLSLATRSLVLIGLVIGAVAAARELRGQLLTPSADARVEHTTEYLVERTSSDDTVLVWGAEAAVNFLTGRAAPTRFVYQYPLYTAGYTRDGLVAEFMGDLRRRSPRFVIDTSSTNPIIPSLANCSAARIGPADPVYTVPAAIHQVCLWIDENYAPVDRIGEWTVLARRALPSEPALPGEPSQQSRSRP